MSLTDGPFDFRLTRSGGRANGVLEPRTLIVQVCVRRWGRVVDDPRPIISQNLFSEREIDAYIVDLKAALEQVGRSAKQALRDARSLPSH